MSAQYRIGGTDTYVSHETVDSCVMKAFHVIRRKMPYFVKAMGEEDLIQSGWMAVLSVISKGFIPDHTETYLYRTVMNNWSTMSWRERFKHVSSRSDVVEVAASSTDVEDSFLTREMAAAVDRALTRLSGGNTTMAIGAELLREEVESEKRKEATHIVAERHGITRQKLWAYRREAVACVKEILQ